MKKLFYLIISFALFSCSTEDNVPLEDCEGKRAEINDQYDAQVTWVINNTSPVNYRQIELINEERAADLEKACD